MFPTTIWTIVRAAGARDPEALQQVAEEYRTPVLAFIRSRGVAGQQAEDLCQDVFVRLLRGGVLAKADADKGRFRSLLCTVTIRVIQDWTRRQPQLVQEEIDRPSAVPDFDGVWVRFLLERALRRLREASPGYYDVVRSQLRGEKPDRNKLWIARSKLIAYIRAEIARTCRTSEEAEQEIAHLTPYLRPFKKD